MSLGALRCAGQQAPGSLLGACANALHAAVTASLARAGCLAAQAPQQPLPLLARAKHTVRMVLLQDHAKLGKRGDIVRVKAGRARYALFPSGQADYAIPSVLRTLKAQGRLSEQALQQLRDGFKERGAAQAVDPAMLPAEQQLPRIVKLLSSKTLVVSRPFNRTLPERPMLGEVTARQLAAYAAKQLKVELPPELIAMSESQPIRGFGSYKVPLALRDTSGRQVELGVLVRQTYRRGGAGLLRMKLFAPQPAAAAAGGAGAAQA